MKCPCCKKENPKYPQICPLCGYDATARYEPATSRAGKAAVASFVLAILSFFAFLITAIPAIILACIALRDIRRTPDRLKGKRLAIAGIIVSVFTSLAIPPAFYSLWRLDAPPIPNDYTIADLRSAPAECARSFDLIKTLEGETFRLTDFPPIGSSIEDVEVLYQQSVSSRDANVPVIGLFAEDVKVLRDIEQCIKSAHGWSDIAAIIDEHDGAIMQAWENGLKGRRLIEELNRFAEIADLTEPNLLGEWRPPTRLKTLVYLYDRAAIVLARRGDVDTCIAELAQVNAVIRKLSVNVRSSIWRSICDSTLVAAMDTANFIANDPNIPLESVAALADHFRPLAGDETSLRNSVIFEYLMIRGMLDRLLKERGSRSFRSLKYNSSCRLLRNFCDDWIQSEKSAEEIPKRGLSVWPTIYPDIPVALKADEFLPWYYLAYNPIGGLLIEIPTRAMDSAFGVRMRVLIYDDLLQTVFNKRLGRPVSLKARAYGDEYIVDIKGKRILSPGPDGLIDTADDIKLPINPEVLGWEE